MRVSCVVSFGAEVFLCDACDVEVHGANAVRRRKLTRASRAPRGIGGDARGLEETRVGDGRVWEDETRGVDARARCERGTRERRD